MSSSNNDSSVFNPTDQIAKRRLAETSPESLRTTGNELIVTVPVADLRKMMEDIMEDKLKNVSTKSDIEGIKLQIDDVNSKFEEIQKENEILKEEINQLKIDRQKDHQQIQRILNQGRRKNVIFKGIMNKGSPRKSVEEVCKRVMKLPNVQINSARVLFTNNDKISVIAEMGTDGMAEQIFKNLKLLAGSRIKVERDLTEERQLDRKILMALRSEILEADKTHSVFVKNDSIKIGVHWMKWNKSQELMCGEKKAEDVLTELYGEKVKSLTLSYKSLLEKITQKN